MTTALPQGILETFQPSQDGATEDMVVNIGPQHPSTHGVLRLVTTLDGEVVKAMEPVIGYLHRSKEKMAETRSYFQYQPTIDRVEYLSSFYDHYVYVTALERLAGLSVPRRVQYLRMITMELNRITSHLLWFGTFLLDLGASSPFFYAFRDREKIFSLLESITGARMMYNYYRFGGLNQDAPPGWLDEVRRVINELPHRFDEYEAIVNKNPIILDRCVGVGIVDKPTLLAYGVTGPSLRASGVAQDLRKTNPYCCYDEVDFDVPTQTVGDVYARYVVRMGEMRESLRIVHQALDQIPGGDTAQINALRAEYQAIADTVDAAKKRVALAKKAEQTPSPDDVAQAAIPAPELDFDSRFQGAKINLLTWKPPAGEAFAQVESPRGMLGCYLISDGSPKAYRVKWRGASFSNLSILPSMMVGNLYPDLMAIFGSLDVILPEVDR
ncbi:MAG: NADH-quinone oxidoreductase subunit D [Vampirovibrionales bacterium]|nr:NADH-quinone oxidoreductase subunit D [Vampirovibrionales bacterium]